MQTLIVNDKFTGKFKEVVTKYVLGERKERHGDKIGLLILSINTSKGYNGGEIVTDAVVSWHGDGSVVHAFSFAGDVNGDFRKTLIKTPCKRVTQKLVEACHAEAQVCFNTVLSEALTHYGISQEQYIQYPKTA